jgi:hypothetical protein
MVNQSQANLPFRGNDIPNTSNVNPKLAPTISTGQNSPDTLPPLGYTRDQLANYIRREMGEPNFSIELTQQQILDAISDALNLYSIWRPRLIYTSLSLTMGVYEYTIPGLDPHNLGVVDVQFTEPNPVPTEIFYGNLIDPAPLFRTGLDEYDTFLRWRKLWMRVTSVRPDWLWDDERQVLFIHNSIQRYQCMVLAYGYYSDTVRLPMYGAQWVKKYALQKARYIYGDSMNKFSGAIPGPIKDLQLDTTSKRDSAEAKLEKYEEELKMAQVTTPIMID